MGGVSHLGAPGQPWASLSASISPQEEDVPFQSCLTPDREPGHCRHVRFCVLKEFKDDFNRFKDYACVIEGRYSTRASEPSPWLPVASLSTTTGRRVPRYIGVCCPDDKDISDTSRDYIMPSNRSRMDVNRRPARPWGRPMRTRRRKPGFVRDRDARGPSGGSAQRFRVGGDSQCTSHSF